MTNKIFSPNGDQTGGGSNAPQTDNTKLVAGPTVYVSPDGGTTNEAFPKQGVEYDFCVDVVNNGTLPSGAFYVHFTLSGDQNPPFEQDFKQDDGLDAGHSVKAVVHFGSFPNEFKDYLLEACVYSPSAPDTPIHCAGTFDFPVNTESTDSSGSTGNSGSSNDSGSSGSSGSDNSGSSDVSGSSANSGSGDSSTTPGTTDTTSSGNSGDSGGNNAGQSTDPQPVSTGGTDSEGFKLLDSGSWNGSATLNYQGGQAMHFALNNVNVLGTTITINSNLGGNQSLLILPAQSVDMKFTCFGSEPMGWTFDISSDSDAFILAWKLYSSWVPGDPPNG
jgi:hypothetical protein